eukprot:10269300-Alexandrium_andersonii.AAC.1
MALIAWYGFGFLPLQPLAAVAVVAVAADQLHRCTGRTPLCTSRSSKGIDHWSLPLARCAPRL